MKNIDLIPTINDNMKAKLENYAEHETLFELLEEVVYKNDFEMFNALIEAGMDVNLQNKYGWTPLHVSIRRDRRDMVMLLLDKDADINMVDGVGWTPLMESVMDDMPELCELLLKNGADTAITNQRDATAVMLVRKFARNSMMHLF